jgi:hypothetical protein
MLINTTNSTNYTFLAEGNNCGKDWGRVLRDPPGYLALFKPERTLADGLRVIGVRRPLM